ncbi:MAG: CDP-alcohol phosphatidyltransferase family protein [Candidatus Marinimicrobia bacterium]|nr:CDP-alcohol phosphatidyltransferase family protein [Candidatus Neomarinimicrobiota bacterium]MCF7921688.1 CDP-alcohol phosphatidyltransferase family protein [Candidatus Neomarinimicrobiota bacterium]
MLNRHHLVEGYYKLIKNIVSHSPLAGMNPNSISLTASIIGVVAAFFFLIGHSAIAGIFLLLSGILDTLDGTVARLGERASKFGAVLDSSLDRYVEMFVFMGITYHFKDSPMFFWSFLAIMGSMMVSYIRARAQSLGVQELVGFMQRFERFVILAAGAIFNAWGVGYFGSEIVLEIAIIFLALGTNYTAYQRLMIVKKVEEEPADPS